MDNMISYKQIEEKVLVLQEQSIILDSDAAELYGVGTREINQAVKNNPGKFPEGYIISLNDEEWEDLKSKYSTLSGGGKNKLPKAFTEKGLYMLATILKNPKATETAIAIVETFAKLRQLSRSISELSETAGKDQQRALLRKSGEVFADILDDDVMMLWRHPFK